MQPVVLTSGVVTSALDRMEALKKESDLGSLLRLAGGVAGALNAQDGGMDGDERAQGDVEGGATESAVRQGLMANIAGAIDDPNFGNELALQAIGTVSQQFEGARSVAAPAGSPGRAVPNGQPSVNPEAEATASEAVQTTLDDAATVVQASVALLGASDVSDGGAAAPLEALGQVLMLCRLALSARSPFVPSLPAHALPSHALPSHAEVEMASSPSISASQHLSPVSLLSPPCPFLSHCCASRTLTRPLRSH